MDAVNLIKSIRKLKMLTKILIPQRSRLLLKFSKNNLIETSNSSTDSDDNKQDTVKLLNGKNNLVKLSEIARITKSLSYYKYNEMDDNDKIFLSGVFVRKPKDFHETNINPEKY